MLAEVAAELGGDAEGRGGFEGADGKFGDGDGGLGEFGEAEAGGEEAADVGGKEGAVETAGHFG